MLKRLWFVVIFLYLRLSLKFNGFNFNVLKKVQYRELQEREGRKKKFCCNFTLNFRNLDLFKSYTGGQKRDFDENPSAIESDSLYYTLKM